VQPVHMKFTKHKIRLMKREIIMTWNF